MINVYAYDCDDFSTNGLAVLHPTKCTVSGTINGKWELQLEHELDDAGAWKHLKNWNIVKVDVPVGPSYAVNMLTYPPTDVKIYEAIRRAKVYPASRERHDSSGYSNNTVIDAVPPGGRVLVLKTDGSYYEVETEHGVHGRVPKSDFSTTALTIPGVSGRLTYAVARAYVCGDTFLRAQPFRICKTTVTLDKVTVIAQHIFYDLTYDIVLAEANFGYGSAQRCLDYLNLGGLGYINERYTRESDITSSMAMPEGKSYINYNCISVAELLLGDNGYAALFSADVARDWYDIYLLKRLGSDNGMTLRAGSNLTSLKLEYDVADIATRFVPIGYNGDSVIRLDISVTDGDTGYTHTSEYDHAYVYPWSEAEWKEKESALPFPVYTVFNYTDMKLGSTVVYDGDEISLPEGPRGYGTLQKYLYKKAMDKLDANENIGLPKLTLSVDFVDLAQTEEYEKYENLQRALLGDTVRVYVPKLDVDVSARLAEYTFDCLTKRYTKVTLGNSKETIGSIILKN